MQFVGPRQPPVPSFPGQIKMQVRQCKGKGAGIPSTTRQHGREMQAGAATPEVVLGRGAGTGGGVKGFSVPAHHLGPSSNLPVHAGASMFPVTLQEREGTTCPGSPAARSIFCTVLPLAYFRVQSGTSFQASGTYSYFMCPLPAPRRDA